MPISVHMAVYGVSVGSALMAAGLYAWLWRGRREAWLGYWSAAWLVFAGRNAAMVWPRGGGNLPVDAVIALAEAGAALLFLEGVERLWRRPGGGWTAGARVLVGLGAVWMLAAPGFGAADVPQHLPLFAATAVVFLRVASTFFARRDHGGLAWMTGGIFVLWAAYKIVVPFAHGGPLPVAIAVVAVPLFSMAIAVMTALIFLEGAEGRLADSEARFRGTFEQAAVGIVHVGRDGRILRANHRLADMLGHEPGELAGRRFEDLIHPQDRDIDAAYRAELELGAIPHYSVEKRCLTRHDTVLWFNITFSKVFAPSGEFFNVSVLEDIGLRKSAEAASLVALEELKRSNQELGRFAKIAAHDLKEPCRTVRIYAQMLARRYDDQLDDLAREFLHYMTDSSKRMGILVDDLLAFSTVHLAAPPLHPVALDAVTAEVLADLRPALEAVGGRVEVRPLPMVMADRVHMGQLFTNLISNAVKYRSPDRRLKIRVESAVTDGVARCVVEDNGLGIDSEYLDKIFEMAVRLHTQQAVPGSGIGLAVCRLIVERHGGRIWAESEAGQGSRFFFTLPLAPPLEGEGQGERPAPGLDPEAARP